MKSIHFSYDRKRVHTPDFRDSSDSDSEDATPPPVKLKKRNSGNKLSVPFAARVRNLVVWISGLPLKDYFKVATEAGSKLPVEEEEDEADMDVGEEDIITIEEGDEEQESPNPFLKRLQQSRKQVLGSMGQLNRPSDASRSTLSTRLKTRESEVSCTYDSRFDYRNGRTNCRNTNGSYSMRSHQASTAVSNPPTDIEILLDDEPTTPDPDEIQIISEPPNLQQSSRPARAAAHSATVRSSTPLPGPSCQNPTRAQSVYTAHEVVRLQEKEQYQLLLQKYIHGNSYSYISKRPKHVRHKEAQRKVEDGGSHFKKEVLEQPVTTFLEKYCKPCQLVKPSPKKCEQQPIEIIIDDDDEMEIVDVKLPKHRSIFTTNDYSSPAWLKDLQKSVKAQTEERMMIVQEYEKKLEDIKKERLLEQLKIEEPAEPEFPELSTEMEEMVDKALTGDPEERLCKDIYRKDIDTLSGLSWLNDLVINSYFDLIVERSKGEGYPSLHAYNTFFYTTYKMKGYSAVRRWTRKIDIFSFDLNFIPIHLGVHWCLGVIDHRSKRVCYYDSMGNGEDKCLDLLHDYLMMEHKDKKGVPLDPGAYTTEIMKDIPQQLNGSDCGMFTLKYAEYISRNAKLTFSQKDMPYFRRRMVYELITGKLL